MEVPFKLGVLTSCKPTERFTMYATLIVKVKEWKKIFAFYLHRLEGLYKYIHNGISVLSLAETKMKKELEEIETFLKFHKESLQQVRIFMSDQVFDYNNHNIFSNVMIVMIQLVAI